MAKGQAQIASEHYSEALRIQPEFGRAHLGLGSALVAAGDRTGAVPHLQKAAADSDLQCVRQPLRCFVRWEGKW